jgi:hypothetical protein
VIQTRRARARLRHHPCRPAASRPGRFAAVDPAAQRARDSDARRILERELQAEEEQLEPMRKEYNNGEPERRGDERNYQKYLDRVAEMKAAIARKESDIAAIKREISKLPAVNPPRSRTAFAASDARPTTRKLRGLRPPGHDGAVVTPDGQCLFANAIARERAGPVAAQLQRGNRCWTGSEPAYAARHRLRRWPQRGGHQPLRRAAAPPGRPAARSLPVHVIVNQIDRPIGTCWSR